MARTATEDRSIQRLQDVALWRELQKDASLSTRQIEVAILLVSGLTIRQISVRLGVSKYTANTHYERLQLRLGVRGKTAVVLALLHRSGLLLG